MGSSLNWGVSFRVLFIRVPYYSGDLKSIGSWKMQINMGALPLLKLDMFDVGICVESNAMWDTGVLQVCGTLGGVESFFF